MSEEREYKWEAWALHIVKTLEKLDSVDSEINQDMKEIRETLSKIENTNHSAIKSSIEALRQKIDELSTIHKELENSAVKIKDFVEFKKSHEEVKKKVDTWTTVLKVISYVLGAILAMLSFSIDLS
jgi:hypothetical protein